jgi:hypothetical protein
MNITIICFWIRREYYNYSSFGFFVNIKLNILRIREHHLYRYEMKTLITEETRQQRPSLDDLAVGDSSL